MKREKIVIKVRSVQSTGSHFIMKLLRRNGFHVNLHHFDKHQTEGLVVCPIRDPWDTYVTWKSKKYGDKFNDYDTQWCRFNQAWLDNDELFVLPIDISHRLRYLVKLGKVLDTRLTTDWKKEGSIPHIQVEKVDLSHIYELPVVRKFYGEHS